MKSFSEIHLNKEGKMSDKWEIYLDIYNKELASYRDHAISMLEIGVQNGGSLETWCEFFPRAKNIVGCDINEDILKLTYEDPRVKLFNLDATDEKLLNKITEYCLYDVIIDDGSHTSRDIIKSFCSLFPKMNEGGTFIIEDLHCSYWENFEGGLFAPHSSMHFLKKLSDIINHEHWGVPTKRKSLVGHELSKYDAEIDEQELAKIYSITFYNSVCIIRKNAEEKNVLGKRKPSGQEELVVPGHQSLLDEKIPVNDQSLNRFALLTEDPVFKFFENENIVEDKDCTIAALREEVENSLNIITKKEEKLQSLVSEIEGKDGTIQFFSSEIDDKDIRLQQLSIENSRLNDIENSKFWRLTYFPRVIITELKKGGFLLKRLPQSIGDAKDIPKLTKKAYYAYKMGGFSHLKESVKLFILSRTENREAIKSNVDFIDDVSANSSEIFDKVITIIAEVSIPQCKKYRVDQKKDLFNSLGFKCNTVSWTDYQQARNLISLSSIVIFYRTPQFDIVSALVKECQRLNIKTFWDVDDVIYDEDILKNSKTLQKLDKSVFDGLIDGANSYKSSMVKCDELIGSTTALVESMSNVKGQKAYLLENALDNETISISDELLSQGKALDDNKVTIVYGSGSNTHNTDFDEAAEAIVSILKENDNVVFRLIGHLDLPDCFNEVLHQIERIEFCSFLEYLEYLFNSDISIAPLEKYIFNDFKSNIKYLEASILKVASVCSPRRAFREVIKHGENGLLADNYHEWYQALKDLVLDVKLRKQLAENAYKNIKNIYLPESIAKKQLLPIIPESSDNKTRLMSFNVYYNPKSFGGATIVAEEVNKYLQQSNEYNIYVVTTYPLSEGYNAYDVIRNEVDDITVFYILVPDCDMNLYVNDAITASINQIIDLVSPDICHFHSMQGIGVTPISICKQRNIKYAITLHDAWWICPRQFMLTEKGAYCNQTEFNSESCIKCYGDRNQFNKRQLLLNELIQGASLLLSPSDYFRDLHKSTHPQVITNKNGIHFPLNIQPKIKSKVIKFGYAGGNTPIKGFHLVLEAFKNLNDLNVELIVVDNLKNLGTSSFHIGMFKDIDNIKLVDSYNQKTIDQFFSSIDVLLFPTQWKESFGLTVREAITRNVWVIATDAGGVVEDIIEGKNGSIIPFNSKAKELESAIRKFYNFYKNNESYENGVDLPKEHIRTFKEQASEIKALFDELL